MINVTGALFYFKTAVVQAAQISTSLHLVTNINIDDESKPVWKRFNNQLFVHPEHKSDLLTHNATHMYNHENAYFSAKKSSI